MSPERARQPDSQEETLKEFLFFPAESRKKVFWAPGRFGILWVRILGLGGWGGPLPSRSHPLAMAPLTPSPGPRVSNPEKARQVQGEVKDLGRPSS